MALAALPHAEQPYRVPVGLGLTLVVGRTTKSWTTRFKLAGREHLKTLGTYPAMSLLEAQAARLAVRIAVREGRNPATEAAQARAARAERNAQTFEPMVRAWHASRERGWEPHYATQVLRRIEKYAIPAIGHMPIAEIERRHVLALLERVRDKADGSGGPHIANELRGHMVQAFDYWLDMEAIAKNPAARMAKYTRTPDRVSQPAVLELEELRRLLAQFEAGEASVMLRLLHRFQALTGVRPSEARGAEWTEFAVPGEWRIPAARMKGRKGRKRPHTVYLSLQASEVLAVARALAPLNARYVFPTERYGTQRHQPLERSTLAAALSRVLPARLHVAHGWRASMRTILGRRHRRDRDLIEVMLAHETKGAVERLYDRTSERDFEAHLRELWAEWADLLLEGAPSAWALAGLPEPAHDNVVQIRSAA